MKTFLISTAAIFLVATPALSQETGFFAGIDGGAAFRFGTSSTTDGGAAWGGGGIVRDVQFDTAYSVGGYAGYRFFPNLSTFVSLEHVRGGVEWKADFPALVPAETQGFAGDAVSTVIMANANYRHDLTNKTAIDFTLGLGAAINKIDDVTETAISGNTFSLKGDSKTNFAASAAIGLSHQLTSAVKIGGNAALAHYGDFRTGSQRTDITGLAETIGRYQIDNTWGGTLSGFITVNF